MTSSYWEGKCVVITGAGSGFGAILAERLAKNKVAVLGLTDINERGLEEGEKAIRESGAEKVKIVRKAFDICNEKELGYFLDQVCLASPNNAIDVMYNNAGIHEPLATFPHTELSQLRRVIDIDLTAVILGTALALRRGATCIVNTASMAGLMADQSAAPVYASSKAGVIHFSRSFGSLASQGVRVMAVCPSYSETPMVTNAGPEIIASMKAQVGGQLLSADQVVDTLVSVAESGAPSSIVRVTVRRGPEYLELFSKPLKPLSTLSKL